MSHISRIASPMSLCEEDLFDVNKKVESKIRLLEQRQKESPASFLVGTIGEVNRRITNLDEELSKYDSKLAIDTHTPQPINRRDSYPESYSPAMSLRQATPSERRFDVKNKKTFGSPTKPSDAPRLVELQQYPGWNPKVFNPLPHSLGTEKVLDHVFAAQEDLKCKGGYRREFSRLLYSNIQEFILQDSFWWFFLEKFHPNVANQTKLFKRIAVNFVSLLLVAESPKFRDLFFSSYGDILAQSVYSAFCLAFPQSWRQFDEFGFKELLCRVCGEWISGIPPLPRSYEKWNFTALEPKGMRKEVIKKSKKPDHGMKQMFGGRGGSSYSSTGSTKTSIMKSPTGSHKTHPGIKQSAAKSEVLSSGQSPKLAPRAAELISEHNATLSTITEEPGTSTTESVPAAPKIKTMTLKASNSCAAGRVVEFSKNVFNVYGRSPLLSQFSEQYGFERKSFYDVLVNLTLVKSVPSKDTPTYQDIIAESKRVMSSAAETFRDIHQEDMKARQLYRAQQREENRIFKTKTEKLLSKPKQVRYLSNLILLELKNPEEDTNPVGATATIQAALAAETLD